MLNMQGQITGEKKSIPSILLRYWEWEGKEGRKLEWVIIIKEKTGEDEIKVDLHSL